MNVQWLIPPGKDPVKISRIDLMVLILYPWRNREQ
jgi:hypothetical protein